VVTKGEEPPPAGRGGGRRGVDFEGGRAPHELVGGEQLGDGVHSGGAAGEGEPTGKGVNADVVSAHPPFQNLEVQKMCGVISQ